MKEKIRMAAGIISAPFRKISSIIKKPFVTFYEKHHSGEVLKTLSWDANSLKDSYFSHVFWVAGRLVNGVTSLIAMLIYSPTLM